MTTFNAQVHANEQLAPGATDLYAVVRVECLDIGGTSSAGEPGRIDAQLRLWTPAGAQLLCFEQVGSDRVPLETEAVEVGRWRELPATSWTVERRDYLVGVRASGSDVVRVARLQLVEPVDHVLLAEGAVTGHWVDDPWEWLPVDPDVASCRGMLELAAAVDHVLEAAAKEDQATAAEWLTRASELARATGDDALADRLEALLGAETIGPDGTRSRGTRLTPRLSKNTRRVTSRSTP